MAAFFGNKLVLPIGCSCIGQIQLHRSTRLLPFRPSVFFFDWTGTTPDTTVRILNQRKPFVENEGDLELVNDNVRSRAMPEVYFWHFKPFLRLPESKKISSLSDYPHGVKKFIAHHRYVMDKFGQDVSEIHCLWTNIQPNLKHTAAETGVPWSDLILTPDRYASLKEACSNLRAGKVTTWFVCREEDMDRSLAEREDVIVMDVARSLTESQGDVGLFDPVFERMGICRPTEG